MQFSLKIQRKFIGKNGDPGIRNSTLANNYEKERLKDVGTSH